MWLGRIKLGKYNDPHIPVFEAGIFVRVCARCLRSGVSHMFLLVLVLQLKEQVMLLEAQLEKQLESATSDHNYSEEMTQVGPHTPLSLHLSLP